MSFSSGIGKRLKETFPDRNFKWTRRDMIKLSAVSVATIGLASLGYGSAVRQKVEVSRVNVKIVNLPSEFEGLTMAQLSDIHHGPFTGLEYVDRCVQIVNELKPDLIALTGDLTFGGKQYADPCAEVLKGLRARIGIYAVLGNHDYYAGAGHILRALKNAGFIILIDSQDCFEYRGSKLRLLGVDDYLYGNTDINRLMRNLPAEEPKIVLSHNPDFIEEFAAKNRHIDLMISGHTHGGQVRLPLLGAPHISSEFGQQYAIGMNHKGSMQVYTTRGIGTILLPMRLDCPPEIVLYCLKRA